MRENSAPAALAAVVAAAAVGAFAGVVAAVVLAVVAAVVARAALADPGTEAVKVAADRAYQVHLFADQAAYGLAA